MPFHNATSLDLWITVEISSSSYASITGLTDKNGLTQNIRIENTVEKKDTYILDALDVSKNISKINFKVNYPFKDMLELLKWEAGLDELMQQTLHRLHNNDNMENVVCELHSYYTHSYHT